MTHPLMRPLMGVVCLAATTALTAPPVLAQEAAPVVAAERAFAADGLALGIDRSFHKWSAPDAILIAGGQVLNARAAYPGTTDLDPAAPTLVWWPNWAGVAKSGDMGFTTGGVERGGERRGHYFTIWKRQADGAWRWVYDGGSGASSAEVPPASSEPMILATATVGSDSPEAAMAEVRAAEAALAVAAATDSRSAHLAVLAEDGRLYVAPRPPAIGRDAYADALSGWPPVFAFGPTMGGGASDAGDLAWTWGEATWQGAGGAARAGHYVRLWQKRPEGWKLAFAQLIAAPPPQPAAPAS